MYDVTHRCDNFIHTSALDSTESVHMCNMTHSYLWHDPFMCVIWSIRMFDAIHSHVWHNSSVCVIWLIHMCDMTHSYVWHDSFICVTWLIHMCDMTHSYLWQESFICMTWLSHTGALGSTESSSYTQHFCVKAACTHLFKVCCSVM